jgi:hypothetical protein
MEMELYRSTSIRISTVDCETYIFKSFHQRTHVLQLLRGLKILVDRQQNGWSARDADAGATSSVASTSAANSATAPHTAGRRDESTSSDSRFASSLAAASPLVPSPSLTFSPFVPPPMPSNRRRAVSDSVVGIPRRGSRVSLEQHHHHTDGTADSVNGEDSFIEESDFSLKEAWNEARKPKNPPLQQVGIDVSLCSLRYSVKKHIE